MHAAEQGVHFGRAAFFVHAVAIGQVFVDFFVREAAAALDRGS